MKRAIPTIDVSKETDRIIDFIRQVFRVTQKERAVVACSGGVDSSLAATLLTKALGSEKIHFLMLPYKHLNESGVEHAATLLDFLQVSKSQREIVDIAAIVDSYQTRLDISGSDQVRLGNLMARVRMSIVFDRSKRDSALVCGTENKSEHLLGYFTRFGDEASDIEPLRALYKTNIYELAYFLKLPDPILSQAPTAGLWKGQTDEAEFGFSYEEADNVMFLFKEKHMPIEEIANEYPHTNQILSFMEKNAFKHQTPYRPDALLSRSRYIRNG